MDKKYNQISLSKKDYKSEEEFWNIVRDLTRILLNARYEIECYWEDADVYIFNFNFNHHRFDFGTPHITWIDPIMDDIVSIENE